MNPSADCTLILGVDALHLEELRWTWPTWMRFKPELRQMPAIVFYDPSQVDPRRVLFLHEHPNLRWVRWELPAVADQREKMLTGWLHIPAREVRTPWYLKLDTDVAATGPGEWIKEEWFQADNRGRGPVLVASRWGYTKPRDAIAKLDEWGDTVRKLRRYPRLNLPFEPEADRLRHRRVISWLFFGRTDWTREVVGWLGPDGRLPQPSQDTFLFYCAKRSRRRIVAERMPRYQWAHKQIGAIRRIVTGLQIAPGKSAPTRNESGRHGVIYYNTGTSCAVRLLVSLHSLRRHYGGPVTILSEGDPSHRICRKIASALDADFLEWSAEIPAGRHSAYLAKTRYHRGTPYATTVALDADTLVTGSIGELFEAADAVSFCVAQLGQWTTETRAISRRIRAWSPWLPDWIEPALAFGPAINCGVVAFRRDAALYADWFRFASLGRETFIPDEVCCQILLHHYPHRVLDGRWNRSCRHDDPEAPDTRIVHFHGRKHCRPGLPFHGSLWTTEFFKVLAQDTAAVQSWFPAGDRMLTKFSGWLRQMERANQPEKIEAAGAKVEIK